MIISWSSRSLSRAAFLLRVLSLGAVLFLVSCKDSGELVIPSTGQVIYVALKSSDTYQYPTGAAGDEEGAVITRQAGHFRISEIRRDASTNFVPVYFYQPEAGYIGGDSVALEVHTNKVGAPNASQVSTVGLHFTVTQ